MKASDEWNHPRTFRAAGAARSTAASAALPRRHNRAVCQRIPAAGFGARARKRDPARAMRQAKHPGWKPPSSAPDEYRLYESGRKGRLPRRTLTASWSPCVQRVIWGRQRWQGQSSATPWSVLHRVLPKRILKANPAERTIRALPGTSE